MSLCSPSFSFANASSPCTRSCEWVVWVTADLGCPTLCGSISGSHSFLLVTSLVPFNSFKGHLSHDYFWCQTSVLCFLLSAQNPWFHAPHLSIYVSQHIFHNVLSWSIDNFEFTVHQHGEISLSILVSSTYAQCCFSFLFSMLCSFILSININIAE